MSDSDRTALYIGLGLGGVALIVIVSKLLEKSADTGGIVGAVGDAIIGTPSNSRIKSTMQRPATLPPEAADAYPGGIIARWLDPLNGTVLNRDRFFGSELTVRFELENPSLKGRSEEVRIVTVEDNIFPGEDDPNPQSYGRIAIPARTIVEVVATLFIATTNIIALDVTADLKVGPSGDVLDRVKFAVG